MERNFRHRIIRLSLGVSLATMAVALFLAAQFGASERSSAKALAPAAVPQVAFLSNSSTFNENVGSATIFVTMDVSSTSQVTVEYLTIDGTATAGSDYQTASGVLTFTPGIKQQNFVVTIINDTNAESRETINLVLRNPVNATLSPDKSTSILEIADNDPTPTATATATTGAPPVFVDVYEPNNALSSAYAYSANAANLCSATLWPIGDEDYFKFWGRAGSSYRIFTTNLVAGIDTAMTVYNTAGAVIATNDDFEAGNRRSELEITASSDGYYYARIVNQDPTDPANKTYCFGAAEFTKPTPTATMTPEPPVGDECEYNSTFATACLIGAGETKSLNFVPSYGSQRDTDIFALWMKPGIQYTCETLNLSAVNDTNIILYDANGNPFNPPIGNDDKAPGDLGSKVTYFSTYAGWLYVMVGPVSTPPLSQAELYTYDLTCAALAATPTPTPPPTSPPLPPGTGGTGGSAATPTMTPVAFPTFPPTPTPIDLSQFSTQAAPTAPSVRFQPLATATPVGGGARSSELRITLYYDNNDNFEAEAREGIVDVAVALYDNATGQLLQFGHTNESGLLNFGSIEAVGALRVEVPFLSYSQIVVGSSSHILVRVAPQPLPLIVP